LILIPELDNITRYLSIGRGVIWTRPGHRRRLRPDVRIGTGEGMGATHEIQGKLN